ncbi:hypothetical protein C1N60_07660 [Pantoea sp. SGAir0184]|nr:hypothetical protein C1Y43_22060 [Pantoea sp. ICBG 828]PPC72432.1 hypothetical protein C1Y42_07795 [Pantoea sp. ICBG 985]
MPARQPDQRKLLPKVAKTDVKKGLPSAAIFVRLISTQMNTHSATEFFMTRVQFNHHHHHHPD